MNVLNGTQQTSTFDKESFLTYEYWSAQSIIPLCNTACDNKHNHIKMTMVMNVLNGAHQRASHILSLSLLGLTLGTKLSSAQIYYRREPFYGADLS